MAFSLGDWAKAKLGPFQVGVGTGSIQPPTIGYHFEMADQNVSTSPVMQAPSGIAFGRAVIRQKNFTSGSGTVGPTYELQVAYDSGFTSQLRTIAQAVAGRTGRDQTFLLQGVVPDMQSLTFGRVALTKSGTDDVTYDALVDFTPGV
jgi:hypothetical protein